MQCLSRVAEKQPQAAFAALTKSPSVNGNFYSVLSPIVTPLDDVLASTFLPAVFGCEVTPQECLLFSLPVRFGGLGFFVLNVLLSLPFLPVGMLPRLLFRLFMALGLLKLIAMRRLFFVLIRIL